MEKEETFKLQPYLVFLFSLYIYSFRFRFRGYLIIEYFVFCILPVVYLLLNIKMLIKLFRFWDKRRFACIVMILISVFFSIVVPMLYNTNDYTYFRTVVSFVIRKMIPYVFLCVCLIKKYGKDACAELFMYYFAMATVCYVCGTCLLLLAPPLQDFWMKIVTPDRNLDLLVSAHGYVGRIGWSGFSGFRATMRCSVSVVFLMHMRFSKNSKFRIGLRTFLVAFIFAVLGNAFYGRTGLLASAIIVVFSLVAYRRLSLHSIIRWMIGFAIIFVGFYILSLSNYRMHEWFMWMSSPFINILETGSFNTSSVNVLLGRMLFMPEISTLLLGDGLFQTPFGYYMNTDLGFLRQILFWGLPATLMSYVLTYESIRTLGGRFWVLIWASVICVAIFEFKSLAYYEFVTLFLAIGFLEKERVQI